MSIQEGKKTIRQVVNSKYACIPGLLMLPVLFGMSMTCLEIIQHKEIEVLKEVGEGSSVGAKEIVEICNMKGMSTILSAAMFFGAFLVSFVLFVCSYYKITAYGMFKQLMCTAGVLMCMCSIVMANTNLPIVLIACRVLVGIAVGLICGVETPYYIYKYGNKKGTQLGMAQGLCISAGIMLEGQIRMLLSKQTEYIVLYIMASIAAVCTILIMLTVENTKNKQEEEAEQRENSTEMYTRNSMIDTIDKECEEEIEQVDEHNNIITGHGKHIEKRVLEYEGMTESMQIDNNKWIRICACLVMHLLQQATGINAILSEQGFIFAKDEENKYRYAKMFFDISGLTGSLLGTCITSILHQRHYSIYCLVTTLIAGAGIVPLSLGWREVGWWSAGVYFAFFSMAVSSLPWMLPSKLLQNEKNVSLAIGLGSMLNWLISCMLLLLYRPMYDIVGANVFYTFVIGCVGCSVFAYVLLEWNRRQREQAKREQAKKNSTHIEEQVHIAGRYNETERQTHEVV